MTYYKVLLHGRSCHGGDAEWALPKQREDGTWEPGEWMPEIRGTLELYANGYHLTREPARWWRDGAECYVAEWDGEYVGDGSDKIAVRRCRLLRKLSNGELAALRILADGSHVVMGGFAVAFGSAQVWAHGYARVAARDYARVWARDAARVWASGYARVEARDSARVEARDYAQVRASGYATVDAYDSARVWARDSAQVDTRGFARVEASGLAQVWAHDSAQVWAHDSAQVWASGSARVWASGHALVRTQPGAWGQPTVMTSGAAVWVDYRSGVPAVHTAEGRCEPVASGLCDQRSKGGER